MVMGRRGLFPSSGGRGSRNRGGEDPLANTPLHFYSYSHFYSCLLLALTFCDFGALLPAGVD